jgi:hypothetical protein
MASSRFASSCLAMKQMVDAVAVGWAVLTMSLEGPEVTLDISLNARIFNHFFMHVN